MDYLNKNDEINRNAKAFSESFDFHHKNDLSFQNQEKKPQFGESSNQEHSRLPTTTLSVKTTKKSNEQEDNFMSQEKVAPSEPKRRSVS